MEKLVVYLGAAKSGGAVPILENFVSQLLSRADLQQRFKAITVIVPRSRLQVLSDQGTVSFMSVPTCLPGSLQTAVEILLWLPIYMRLRGNSVLLNFADIPAPFVSRQALLFDWPYAIYDDAEIWRRMHPIARVSRKLKYMIMKALSGNVSCWIAQTNSASKRLNLVLPKAKISVVPNAVGCNLSAAPKNKVRRLTTNSITLYYITRYYPHKNIEILIEVARKIKASDIRAKIILTLDKSDKDVQNFFSSVEKASVGDVILNRGPIPSDFLESFYREVDCLLMPTLLESFSSAYLEAMSFGLPILTSEQDFAQEVCSDAAIYFDPLDPDDIVFAIRRIATNEELFDEFSKRSFQRLGSFQTWDRVFEELVREVEGI